MRSKIFLIVLIVLIIYLVGLGAFFFWKYTRIPKQIVTSINVNNNETASPAFNSVINILALKGWLLPKKVLRGSDGSMQYYTGQGSGGYRLVNPAMGLVFPKGFSLTVNVNAVDAVTNKSILSILSVYSGSLGLQNPRLFINMVGNKFVSVYYFGKGVHKGLPIVIFKGELPVSQQDMQYVFKPDSSGEFALSFYNAKTNQLLAGLPQGTILPDFFNPRPVAYFDFNFEGASRKDSSGKILYDGVRFIIKSLQAKSF